LARAANSFGHEEVDASIFWLQEAHVVG